MQPMTDFHPGVKRIRGIPEENVGDIDLLPVRSRYGATLTSCWEPTLEDMQRMIRNGRIYATVLGWQWPPMALDTRLPAEIQPNEPRRTPKLRLALSISASPGHAGRTRAALALRQLADDLESPDEVPLQPEKCTEWKLHNAGGNAFCSAIALIASDSEE